MKSKFKLCFDYFFKIKIFICIVFVFTFTMISQGSNSFPFNNSLWKYGVYDISCSGLGSYCGQIMYEFQGDTVLSNKMYHKLYMTNPQDTLFNYVAAIRQDSLSANLYILYASGQCNNSDTLLYSFRWNISDTLKQCDRILGQIYSNILSIDSILLLGQWKIKINLQSQFNTQLIEDIGSTTGLIGPWEGWIDGNMILECFQLSGVSIYPSSNCGLNNTSNMQETKRDYIIYPTFADKEIIIKTKNVFDKMIVKLINMNAQTLLQMNFNFDSNHEYRISTGDIKNGMYILQLSSGAQNIFSIPIIVNH